jgi:hypothetical protein
MEKIAEESFNSLRLEQLVFSRWSQVMYRFEKAMYEDPEQDLNALWWNLVETYQFCANPKAAMNPIGPPKFMWLPILAIITIIISVNYWPPNYFLYYKRDNRFR